MRKHDVYRQRTSLTMILVGVGIFVGGCALLYLASFSTWLSEHPNWHSVVQNTGGLFVATAVLSVLWELAGRRAFLSELLSVVKVSEDVQESGLVRVARDYATGIDWADLFRDATEVDLFFCYARTWRANHTNELRALARRKKARVRVVLPDPEDTRLIDELRLRFGAHTDEDLVRSIHEAERDLRDIFTGREARCAFDLKYHAATPVFTLYRFDSKAVAVFYQHRSERSYVPALEFEKGGYGYEFLAKDFDALFQNGRSPASNGHTEK